MYIPPLHGSTNDASLLYTAHHPGGSEKIEKWSTLIGVVTAICGNILISFALNTQRYAHMRLSREREEQAEKLGTITKRSGRQTSYGTQSQEAIAEERARVNAKTEPEEYTLLEEDSESRPLIPKVRSRRASASSDETALEESPGEAKEESYLRSPIWWAGITMMTVGEAGNFLAYGFAPASLVSPLGVVALVSNCLIAPLLLHEPLRWRDGLGVVIAVGGCVTVVLSASDNNPKLTQDAIWVLITQWEFETYMGVTVFVMILLAFASNRFGDKTVLIDLGLVALFGGYTALSTKGVASLLSNTIWRIVTFPITYLLVAVLVFTAVMQIKYLNRALQRFNATVVIPTQFVLFTISVILGSAVLYRDFERTTTEDALKFIGGCALTFLGVWCITSGRTKESNDSEDEEEEEEGEAIDLVDEEGVQPEIREREDETDGKGLFVAGSSSQVPIMRRSRTSDAVASTTPLSITPTDTQTSFAIDESPLVARKHLVPANASAIHDAPLGYGDGAQAGDPTLPPPMHTTTSAPVVPTTSSVRPHTPLDRTTTGPTPSTLNTPVPRLSLPSDHLDTPGRQRLLNRHSMAGLIPAPFTSPLSNSLSAIVADSLRRGVKHTPISSVRRRLARSKSGRARHDTPKHLAAIDAVRPKRHSIASGDMPFDEIGDLRDSAARSGSLSSVPGRMRSMSATLSDIFSSGKKQRMERRDTGPDRS